jgi:hypothetical protein
LELFWGRHVKLSGLGRQFSDNGGSKPIKSLIPLQIASSCLPRLFRTHP